MENVQRKTSPIRPTGHTSYTPSDLLLADDNHRENLAAAQDMLEFMRVAFITDDGGMVLSASAARGVEEILQHIQNVVTPQSQAH